MTATRAVTARRSCGRCRGRRRRLVGASDEEFAGEAEAAMGGFLGSVALLAPRSSYPLGFHHAATITAERLALIGDSAHAIHPIAVRPQPGIPRRRRAGAGAGRGARLGLDSATPIARPLRAGERSIRCRSQWPRRPHRLYGVPAKPRRRSAIRNGCRRRIARSAIG